jgi:hypothetical protein
MSVHDQTLLSSDGIFERRSRDRTSISRGALLFFPRSAAAYTLAAFLTQPIVELAFDWTGSISCRLISRFLSTNFCTVHRSRLIWREGDFIGVKFEG